MKTTLRDSHNGLPIRLPKIHGNKKIRNLLTGKKDRTMGQWRRQAKESVENLIKALNDPSAATPI